MTEALVGGILTALEVNMFVFIDPVGAKRPAFSSEARLVWFDKVAAHSFALLCEAQSYPIPSFR